MASSTLRPAALRRRAPEARSRPVPSTAPARRAPGPGGWLIIGFILAEITFQLALLVPHLSSFRIIFRSAAFVGSLVLASFLLTRPAQSRAHPSLMALVIACAFVSLGLVHPDTSSWIAGIATLAMYCAIAAPVLWVSRLWIDETWMRRIVLTLWIFSSLSAMVGVIQTLRPDWQWLQPNLSSVIQNFNDGGEGLKISLASGAQVFRPMGLSDQPGAAAMAGLTCVVFGTALLLAYRNPLMRAACLSSMVMGVFCIYLSQVRSVLVMTGVCMIAFFFVMGRRGDFARAWGVMIALASAIFVATVWAFAIGGETVKSRLSTLIEDDPRMVYYQNRGHFLEYTFRHALPTYPLGAGLGRWGMVNYYFGDQTGNAPESLWAEIMWTGWVYDGGILLMIAYVSAVGIAMWHAWRIGTRREFGSLGLWGATVFAFNVGCLAVTFNYPFFMSQSGLDFWLLNAALFGAAQVHLKARAMEVSTPARRAMTS